MALPLRGTAKSGTATNGGDVTLTFDVGGDAPQEGDVVILFGGRGNSSDANAWGPLTAGYTAIFESNGTGAKFGVWYKVMGASPDTSVQGEGGGAASSAVAYGAFVLDGALIDPAIFDAAASTVAQGARVPNCPAITTVTDGAWVVALYGNGLVDTSRGAPAGYTTIVGASANDSDDLSIDAAYLEKASAGAEDPGNWSTWSSGTGAGCTIAIRPAAAAAVSGDGTLSAQPADARGAGASGSGGSGALAMQGADASGSGTSSSRGSASLQAAVSSVAGAGTSGSAGAGALAAAASTVTGTSVTTVTGEGDLVAGSVSVGGAGISASAGAGALLAQAATLEASGSSGVDGAGSIVVASVTLEGAGASGSSGAGGLAAQAARVNGYEGTLHRLQQRARSLGVRLGL